MNHIKAMYFLRAPPFKKWWNASDLPYRRDAPLTVVRLSKVTRQYKFDLVIDIERFSMPMPHNKNESGKWGIDMQITH